MPLQAKLWTGRSVRLVALVACASAISISLLLLKSSWSSGSFPAGSAGHNPLYKPSNATASHFLPADYTQQTGNPHRCSDRFDRPFLEHLSATLTHYCTEASSSQLSCFRSTVSEKRTDSFCIGTPVSLNQRTEKFDLACELRSLTETEVNAGVPELAQFPSYWYETGPRKILESHVQLHAQSDFANPAGAQPKGFTILVRREAPIDNLFHHFMQIFSVFLTLDALQMTTNPATKQSYFNPVDTGNNRVVILDDHDEGPFYDQWAAFGKHVVRLSDAIAEPTPPENIIIPLAGVANPFWQGDWAPDDCADAELLAVFSKRMLRFYDIEAEIGKADRPLVLTFIDRTEKRSLVGKPDYIAEISRKYPAVTVNLVNFASLSFSEQIKTIRSTDILAGVHGAGLTHGIFLPPSSTIVEILPPGFNHRGFRNLAKRLGHRYFSTHAVENQNYTTEKGWQYDDIFIEQDRFNGLIDAALKSMYHRGFLTGDVD